MNSLVVYKNCLGAAEISGYVLEEAFAPLGLEVLQKYPGISSYPIKNQLGTMARLHLLVLYPGLFASFTSPLGPAQKIQEKRRTEQDVILHRDFKGRTSVLAEISQD